MNFTVTGQRLVSDNCDLYVSRSVDIYEAVFAFDESWDGFSKTAVFQTNSETAIEVILVDDVCTIPHEVLAVSGQMRIGVYGVKDEQVMPTVWGQTVRVHLGTPTGSIGTTPTPSVYAQILAEAEAAHDIAEAVQGEWESVTASAETLGEGESATVQFEDNDFHFGIPKGDTGAQGEPGFSPTITVIDISGGHRVTITDSQGMESFDVLDGHDGVSPTVAITDITGGHRVVVTDKNGSQSFDVMDGEQGAQGVGIASIAKTSTVGLVDTYTITLTNGNTSTFTVTNGQDGTSDFAEYLPIDSASGSIASFVDGAKNIPVESLKVNISPVQNLNGQSSPYPSGGGKNKALLSAETITKPSWYSGGWTGVSLNSNNGITQTRGYQQGAAGGFALPLAEGEYTISLTYTGTTTACMLYVTSWDGSSQTVIANNQTMSKTDTRYRYTFTVPSGSQSVAIRPTIYTASEPYNLNDIQIESGATATVWSPYENICPIYGHTQADVVGCGENLFDEANADWVEGKGYNADGEIVTASTVKYSELFVPVAPSTEFTLQINRLDTSGRSLNVVEFDKNQNFIQRTTLISNTTAVGVVSKNWTTQANTYFIRIQMQKTQANNVALNLGSTALTYSAYTGTTHTIPFGQTVYGGSLEVETGVLTVTHVIVNMGSINWSYSTTRAYFLGAMTGRKINSAMMCSMFPYKGNATDGAMADKADMTLWGDNNGQAIKIKDSAYTDAATFKTAMNGAQLVYELAEPQTIQLTPVEVLTILGQNNIYSNTGSVEVVYRADIQKYVDKKISALASLI